MTTRSKIALGILGAAAAGVCIGLLVAPEKGNDTRRRIKDSTGDWVDSVGKLFTKGRNYIGKQKREMESMVPGINR